MIPAAYKVVIGRKPSLWLVFWILIISSAFITPFLPSPGIDQPTAIGPYLNNIFSSTTPGGGNEGWAVELAFPNLVFIDPLAMVELPDQSGFYIVSKPGVIYKISNDPNTTIKTSVLDISSLVDTDEDSGLTNMILHPEFGEAGSPNRGYIYVTYRYHPDGNQSGCDADAFIRLSRFNLPDGSENFDPNSEFVLIQQFDTHCWHNGGGMFFGPDSFLYITFGDAGGTNDQYNTTQQLDEVLMGGLLRIDVGMNPLTSHAIRRQPIDPANKPANLPASFSQGYFIPNDNPWLDVNGSLLEEFFAIGLRSPHRMSYDSLRDEIWLGDVGQGSREEISIIEKGGNYQWPYMEGFKIGPKAKPDPLIGFDRPPIYDYTHAVGNSVIGGFIYRGSKFVTSLSGKYIFGDHGVRNIWTLNPDNGEVVFLTNVPGSGVGSKNGIASFATDSNGEVYILKLFGTNQDGGLIYKLTNTSPGSEPPALLSQTGAFTNLNDLTPAPGLVPYTVNSPLWSDGAVKKRWIALPNNGTHNTADEQITFSATSEWQFPPGTVFVKHFELPVDENNPLITKRVETRFVVRIENGGIYAVTYKWNDEQTDAELLLGSDTKPFQITRADGSQDTQVWEFPSRTACMTCHNTNANFVLGIKTWQLNGDYTYLSGITDNQLNTWQHLGMFANPFSPAQIPDFLKSVRLNDNSQSLEVRVRSYLDANCAQCHRLNGVDGAFDARFSVPLELQNLVNFIGISSNTPPGTLLVKPLDPANSEIWVRDHSVNVANAMPPLAKSIVDDEYITVLTDWINSLPDCETTYLSDLTWAQAPINGWGPVELDKSNGGSGADDGNTMTINGQVFSRGLGVHAASEIIYTINNEYQTFQTYIGVDDATCGAGSVQFQVYTDGMLAYQSPVLTQADDALPIIIDVIGVNQLRLVVNNGNGSNSCDHADWADAKLRYCMDCNIGSSCDDGDPCSTDDSYDATCNCSGTVVDSDADTVPDGCDVCPGFDDTIDLDFDGVPDGCDVCLGFDDAIDLDFDGVPDGCDVCLGFDDAIDLDFDGVPDGCDLCPDADDSEDADVDGVPDRCDECPGFDDALDADNDGIPDHCDNCIGQYGASCPTGDCTINGSPIASGIYAAVQRISSGGLVETNDHVVFQAGNIIELKPGFQVKPGGLFHAVIVECEDPPTEALVATENPKASIANEPILVEGRQDKTDIGQIVKQQYRLKELEVQISPNPFRDEFNLYIKSPLPELKNVVVRIMDISGRIIFQKFNVPFDEKFTIIPHDGWVSGIYLVRIQSSEYGATMTIVKQ